MGAALTLNGDIALLPATANGVPVAVNTYTDDHTSVAADLSALARMNKATANTFTIAPNSSVPCPVPCVQYVNQAGAGATTIAGGAGVTVNGVGGSLTIGAQYATVTLLQVAVDVWLVIGIPFNTAATGPLTGTTLSYLTIGVRSPDGLTTATITSLDGGRIIFNSPNGQYRWLRSTGAEFMQFLNGGYVNFTNGTIIGIDGMNFSQLPSAATADGLTAFIKDALIAYNAAAIGVAAAGGGANYARVYSDGSTWRYG